jgi:hypothetical protein
MSDTPNSARPGGLAAWITAVNIDLSASIAMGRATAQAIAELSPDAAEALKARLDAEASVLEANGDLESATAASLVRRTLEPAG